MQDNREKLPTVLGLAVRLPGVSEEAVSDSMAELKELLKTLGADMPEYLVQALPRPSPKSYFGSGKLEEAVRLAEAIEAEYIVTDDELSAVQIRNIEELTGLPVKDRTSIILDIFANHAETKEGKLQVELAMLEYRLPRLIGKWTHLDRQRGGIGLKGSGETRLETDRRLIASQIRKIQEQLAKTERVRNEQGKKRRALFVPLVSLAGYTNAGKSTLLNALAGSSVEIKDALFTTLDTTSRRVYLGDRSYCILSDTVGFISKLPHSLIKAFRATLEGVRESDLLLLVADASNPAFREHLLTVERVLSEIGAANHKRIYVFNKIDKGLAVPEHTLRECYPNSVFISAVQKTGLDTLVEKISEFKETLLEKTRQLSDEKSLENDNS